VGGVGNPVCLWIPGLTGLGGTVQQNGDHGCGGSCLGRPWGTGLWSEYFAGLCRPWGHGPVELRLCGFVSPAQQALGACTGKAEILQGCAGLGGMAGKAEIVQGWGAHPS
jgi:hypothetical protein